MANLTQMAFTPANGLRDTETYPTQPPSEAAIRDAIQDQADQLRDFINDTLIAQLQAKTTGTSGADYIGSSLISNLNGETVHDQIADLRLKLNDAVTGIVPDGEVTDAKLATDVKVGSLAMLVTAVKTSVVDAINEVLTSLGTLSSLTTTAKTSAVDAINEVNAKEIAADNIASGAVTELKIAADAVTDTRIGERTITDTQVPPTDNRAVLTVLLSSLAYMIKAITGAANWRTAPAATMASMKSSIDTLNGRIQNRIFVSAGEPTGTRVTGDIWIDV